MDEPSAANAFERDKPGTAARHRTEDRIEGVRQAGGVFVAAVRATRIAMVLTDPSLPGNPIVFANQSFLDLSGYGTDEVLGQQPYFMDGPDTDAGDAKRFRQALADDRDEAMETVQYRKDGSRFVASLFLSAFKDEDGRTVHHFLSWVDVTERIAAEDNVVALRKAEAGLRESEERQSFLLKLSDALRAEPSAEAVANRALQMLFEQMGLDRCYVGIYRLEDDRGEFPHQVHDGRLAPLPAEVRLSDFPEALKVAFDRTLVIDDVAGTEGLSDGDRANLEGLGLRAVIASTLRRGEKNPLWAVVAVSTQPRVWTPSEVILVEEVAERTWAAIEQARADVALRKSEDRYRTLFKAIDSGFCIIEMIFGDDGRATDYRFVEANPAFECQSGLVDAIGRRIREFAPDLEEHWFERYGRVALTGESLRVEGEVVPLGRWFDINAFRVGAPEQRRVAVLFTDISDRKQIEVALRASREQFETLVNQAPLGVYLVDGDFVIRQVNPIAAPVFGDIAGGPVGRDFDEVIHILWDANYADEVVRIFRHTLETGEPYVTPERAEHRSDRDTIEYYEWRLDRIMLPDGRHGVVCYFRDISAQVHARKEIEKGRELARKSEERLATELFAMKLLQELGANTETAQPQDVLELGLAATIALHRADFGNVQLFDPASGTLRIAAHRGFDGAFLQRFARVDAKEASACGLALAGRNRRIVEDTETDPEYAGSRDAARSAGYRSVQSTPLFAADGEPLGMLSTHFREPRIFSESELRLTDLFARETARAIERAQAEAALRASEERLRLIIESARDYAIFTTDMDGLIEDWPAGAETVFGYSPQEAEGQPVAMLFTQEDRDARQPEIEFETAARDGKAPDVRWHLRKGGRRVFIEGQTVPLRHGSGEIRGFLKIGQDITDRRLAEEALRESEARFRQFGEASSDLLWIRDAETLAFEYLSPAFEPLYGKPREQVLEANNVKAWAELVHPEDQDLAINLLRKLREGVPMTSEFRVVRPADGEVRWIHDSSFPMFDERGTVERIAGIAQDVTARRNAVELQGTLLAELQHRVRNILAMIQSVIRRTLDTSDSAEEYARHLGGRIAAMARTQVMLTRSAGRFVDLEEILRDELLSVAAKDRQYWCEGPDVALAPKAAEVLTLAIHELATNSVKYGAFAGSKGQIEIRWEVADRDGQRWLLFEWEESRVPNSGFGREGFGTELITRRVPYELRGKGSLERLENGIKATIEFPLMGSNSILETNIPEQRQ